MTGLFSGIIGSLIGAGIQSTIGGIPIREDASKALDVLRRGGLSVPPENWFSLEPSNEQRTQEVYGKIGQHVTGAMQMLGPCMQIAKALEDVAYPRSQLPPLGACMPQKELPRSQTSYKSTANNDPRLLLPGMIATSSTLSSVNSPIKNICKPREVFYSESIQRMENKKTKKTPDKCGKSTKNGANPLVKDKILYRENGKRGKTEPRERDTKAYKFTNTASGCSSTVSKESRVPKSRTQMFKAQNKSEKSFHGKKCSKCQAQIKDIKKSPLLPCGHIVCYKCLTGQTLFKCPKCGLKFE